MYKIDQTYIDKGINIRKEYLDTQVKLEGLATKVEELTLPIEKEISKVQEIENKLENNEYKSKEAFQAEFNPIMIAMEKYQQMLSNVYKPLNDKMESLKKDEENLYSSIKERYPLMSDVEIAKEFNERISF